jgi:hypothetical protein
MASSIVVPDSGEFVTHEDMREIARVASSEITALQVTSDAQAVSSLTTQGFLAIPITSWCKETGTPLTVFSTDPGFSLVDSEAFGIRINDDDTEVFVTSVVMPPDMDDTADVVFHAMGFRVGSSDVTTTLTMGAFFQTVGAAHTADSDAATATSAFAAATTVVSEVTCTILAADVPPAPAVLTLTMVPDANLDADDLVIIGTWIEYTKKLLTS